MFAMPDPPPAVFQCDRVQGQGHGGQLPAAVLAFSFRRHALTLDQACSIGLKSWGYTARNTTLTPFSASGRRGTQQRRPLEPDVRHALITISNSKLRPYNFELAGCFVARLRRDEFLCRMSTRRGHAPGRPIGRSGYATRPGSAFLSFVPGFMARRFGSFIAGYWSVPGCYTGELACCIARKLALPRSLPRPLVLAPLTALGRGGRMKDGSDGRGDARRMALSSGRRV
jgi:hypothetical protein